MLLQKFFLLFLVSRCGGTSSSDFIETRAVRADTEYRLPEGAVEANSYRLELTLADDIFETNEFTGELLLTFKNLKTTKEVVLHSNGIQYSKVELVHQDGEIVPLVNANFESDVGTDFLVLNTETDLVADHFYQIRFEYVAKLRTDEMYGLYRSSYVRKDGTVRYLATSQFQPVHARKVFPCFDEPSYKAEFDIIVNHPVDYSAVGNARGSTIDSGTFKKTTFATTPMMSTYLIALVVSDFDCTETVPIEENIPQFICSRSETEAIRALAVDYAPNITWSLEDFTGVKFSTSKLTKIHQFAIPDFAAGAMENWGLITYREPYLLWDPEESSNRYKQYVISIIAHELAHYWFGNLVTTHWWSDTFLNEGFATYFEYHTTHEVAPDLETDKLFVLEQLQPVLVSDASPYSSPLSSEVFSPAQISSRFSSISYNKGGTIFRMVQHVMGLENFKKGINKYLTEHQFGNTKPEFLWDALEEYAPVLPGAHTLKSLMTTWVDKAGYPVLNVSQSNLNIKVTQSRYLSSGTLPAGEWYIPVTYTVSTEANKFLNTSTKIWFLPIGTLTIASPLQNVDDWIILNNQQIGYYRVDYEEQLWSKISTALHKSGFDGIHELNRAQLVDDYFNFARFGHKTFSQLLNFLTFLQKDNSYYSWYPAFGAFSYMIARTSNDTLTAHLSNYILGLSQVLYNSVPFNLAKNDDHIYTMKKVLVVPWACRLGLKDCIDNAVSAFASYKSTLRKPDKNMRSVTYCNGLRHSTKVQEDWDFLWDQFLKEDLASEKVTILSTLGCTKDTNTLNEYLKKSIDENSGIRRQDALSVFSSVYTGNPEGVDVALSFLIANFQAISEYYGSLNSLSSLFSGLTSRFTKQDQVDKFEEFIEKNDLGDAEVAATTALNTAKTNLEWIIKFEEDLKQYFIPPKINNNSGFTITAGILMYFVVLHNFL